MLNNILSNIYTQIALVFAAFGGLISDQIGGGYAAVIMIALIGIIYAVYDAYQKDKVYTQQNLKIRRRLPLGFLVMNQIALNLLPFGWVIAKIIDD